MSPYITKDHLVVIQKGTPVSRIVAANAILEKLLPGTLEALDKSKTNEAQQLSIEEQREKLFEKLDLSGLESWLPENKEKALDLLAEFHNVFALEHGEMGCTEVTEHHIEVTDPHPFKEQPQNIPEGLLQEVKEYLDHMLNVGAIKLSNSAWSNVVILLRKKDGGLRFCMNFRHLNSCTKKDAFPLPQIHDTINTLKGSKYYITVDLLSGFWLTPMVAESKQYAAFTISMLGFYECESMPFRLRNALVTFQHLMQNYLGELNYTTCLVYLDDVVIYSSTQEEHLD